MYSDFGPNYSTPSETDRASQKVGPKNLTLSSAPTPSPDFNVGAEVSGSDLAKGAD